MSSRILSSCLLFKNEVHGSMTLPGGVRLAYVKCVWEFGSGDGRKLRKEELVALYCIPKILWVMKWGRIEWAGRVASVAESEMLSNTQEEVYLWNVGVDGRIILKRMLNVWAIREWSGLVFNIGREKWWTEQFNKLQVMCWELLENSGPCSCMAGCC